MTTDVRRTIVVGVDGLSGARHVLRWAIDAARLWDADLDVVTAWTTATMVGYEGLGPYVPELWAPEESAQKAVTAVVDDVCGADRPARLRVSVVEGHPGHVLVARSATSELLVVGGGRPGVAGLVLGSVSAYCAAHAACPTVVVHGDMLPPAP